MLAVVDTETGRQRYVQSASPGLRARYAAAAAARHEEIVRRIEGTGAAYLHLSTDRDWLGDTVRFASGLHRARRARPLRRRHRTLQPGGDPMTFLSAWRLLLLVLPLALLVGYVLVQRRRHTQVLRFTSVDLLDSVAPRRQGWQRHVPAAAMLLALVVLTLAFAEPAMAMRTPKDRATIMLTLDTSASMTATDVAPSRLGRGRDPGVAVRREPAARHPGRPGDLRRLRPAAGAADHRPGAAHRSHQVADRRRRARRRRRASATSLDAIAAVPKGTTGKPVPAAIVLMSDGSPTIGDGELSPSEAADAAAQEAKAQKVPINTIAFGTSGGTVTIQGQQVAVPYDPEAMARIAQESGGQSFTAESADQLGSIYAQIGRDVAYTRADP